MFQGDSELRGSTLCLCLFSAALSVLIQPAGSGKFTTDINRNLVRLTAPQSGLMVVTRVLRLLSWMTLNAGDFKTCLWLTSRFHFTDLGHHLFQPVSGQTPRKRTTLARWAFFIIITIPLYALLMTSRGSPWTKFWATCYFSQFLVHEIFWKLFKHVNVSLRINDEWPAKPFARISYSREALPLWQHLPLDVDLVRLELLASSNSCEAVNRLLSRVTDLSQAQTAGTSLTHEEQHLVWMRFWAAVTNTNFIWTCGHYRCLLHKTLSSAIIYNCYLQILATFCLLVWLLHSDLRSFTVFSCERLLQILPIHELIVGIIRTCSTIVQLLALTFIIQGVLFAAKKPTLFGYGFVKIVDFLNGQWMIRFRTCVIFLLLLVYRERASYYHFRLRKTPTAVAWFLEIPLMITWLTLGIILTTRIVRKNDSEKKASPIRGPTDEKSPSAVDSKKMTDTSESSTAIDKSQSAEDEHAITLINYFNFLMFIPAIMFWYGFCNQPKTLNIRHTENQPSDPRLAALIKDGWKYV